MKKKASKKAAAPKRVKAAQDKGVQQHAPSATIGGLQERALLARLSTSRWYGRMTDETITREAKEKHQASGDIGTFTKRLMKREYLADIDRVVNEARRYHKSMTL